MNLAKFERHLARLQELVRPAPKFREVIFVNRDIERIDDSLTNVLWVYLEY